jgi:hypothetical protein
MARADAPAPAVEPDTEEVVLTLDGTEWVARVLGRAGGARKGAIPLLLVGFWPAGSDLGPQGEAFVVARTLADVPVHALKRAWEGSRGAPDAQSPDEGGRGAQ